PGNVARDRQPRRPWCVRRGTERSRTKNMRLLDSRAISEATRDSSIPVTIADIWKAYKFLKPIIHHTALNPSRTLNKMTGAEMYLKSEHTQRSGSFKVRGAGYKISRLTEEQRRAGVIAASAGNHAQGVAIAAAEDDIPCTIVMPENAPLAKVMATQGYGAE